MLEELRRGRRAAVERTRESLALEAFALTARYDAAISRWFAEREEDFPPRYTTARTRRCSTSPTARTPTSARPTTPGGRADAPAVDGLEAARQGAVVQQPARPRLGAGASSRSSSCRRRRSSSTTTRAARRGAIVEEAFERALATDRRAPSAASCASTGRSSAALAEKLNEMFVELVFAPGYDDDALEVLRAEAERPAPRRRGAPAPADHRARHQAGARRAARPGPRRRARVPRGDGGGHRAQAHRGRVGRAAVRVRRCASTCARTRSCCHATSARRGSARGR